jgi:hypothetical protein
MDGSHPYGEELLFFQSIASSNFHLSANIVQREIDNKMAQQILYAMLKHKPVILIQPPTFSTNVNYFSRIVISSRLSKIIICDLRMLDLQDLQELLRNITSELANYTLTRHEDIIIRSYLKSYLRDLQLASSGSYDSPEG